MHVDRIPNRTSPPAFLLRETYREDGKVKKRTLANITHWPGGKIDARRRLVRDGYAPALKLMRSLPHGHVAAALGMLRKLGLDDLLGQGQRQRARMVALVTALVVVRLLDPASKLTTARLLDGTTATSSLGTVLALGKVDEQELYDALDWLLAQQERIETALARRHLSDGTLVLYDVSSTYFEGRTCELANSAITATASPANCKSCSAYCAPRTAAQWRSRFSMVMSPIRQRSPIRSKNSRSGLRWSASCWSGIAAWSP